MKIQNNLLIKLSRSVGDSRAERDILSFQQLEQGWHYGQGEPSSPETAIRALRIVSKLSELGATVFESFPKIDGSIVISAIKLPDVVDITVSSDGSYDLFIERNDEATCDREAVDLDEIIEQVRLLKWTEKSQSDYFIQSIILGSVKDSTAPQSKRQTMASRSSANTVRANVVEQNANTFQYITRPGSVVNHQFSIGSKSRNYLLTA